MIVPFKKMTGTPAGACGGFSWISNLPTSDPSRIAKLKPATGDSQDRWAAGAGLFRDERLRALAVLLDEAFRIPGTQFRFGIDGIIGLVPGFGDVLAGILSLVIPIAAWIRGVPYIALLRMVVNLGVGVLIGSIPLLGDAFDIAWKANRRNYHLLQRHLGEPRRHTWRDWMFLGTIALLLMVIFAIPIVLALWLIHWFLQR